MVFNLLPSRGLSEGDLHKLQICAVLRNCRAGKCRAGSAEQESAEQCRTPVLDSAVCTIFVHILRGSGRSVIILLPKKLL
jgi:hypothetical protein